jgi:hypothetical protein
VVRRATSYLHTFGAVQNDQPDNNFGYSLKNLLEAKGLGSITYVLAWFWTSYMLVKWVSMCRGCMPLVTCEIRVNTISYHLRILTIHN